MLAKIEIEISPNLLFCKIGNEVVESRIDTSQFARRLNYVVGTNVAVKVLKAIGAISYLLQVIHVKWNVLAHGLHESLTPSSSCG